MFKHYTSSDGNKVIILVHGIGGGLITWFNFINYFNLNYPSNNYSFINYTYYKIGSISPTFGKIIGVLILLANKIIFLLKVFWSKRNDYNAVHLNDYIEKNCTEAKMIILVAHSMGGLICRKVLVDLADKSEDISRFKMLVTFATPHSGSHMANFISVKRVGLLNWIYNKFSKKFGFRIFPQLGDLSMHKDDFISNLNSKWKDNNIDNNLLFVKIVAKDDFWVDYKSAASPTSELNKIFSFNGSHTDIINPKNNLEFQPIDCFIDQLKSLELVLDNQDFETNEVILDEELNYDFDETIDDETYEFKN